MQAIADNLIALRPQTIHISKHPPLASKDHLIHAQRLTNHPSSKPQIQRLNLSQPKLKTINDIIL